MGNKIDLSKLIRKKYSGNTLQLDDLFEEIDLVLNEAVDYKSKVAGQASDATMEEASMEQKASWVVNGAGVPRNARPDSDQKKFIPADKIAEEGKSKLPTIQGTQEMPVFDLFSMITNSQMSLEGDDRKLINDIVENMGGSATSSWRDRVALMQKYAYLFGEAREVSGMNIREAISNLMFINLLKKLSYFMDQPSKQFEYVIAPLISPNAYVIPKDGDLADVRLTTGEQFSIKFWIASNPELKGSIGNLKKYPNGLKYVFGKRLANGILEFGECEITCFIKNISPNDYTLVNSNIEGVLIYGSTSATPKIKIYVKNFDAEEYGKFNSVKDSFETGKLQKAPKKTEFTHTAATNLRTDLSKIGNMNKQISSLYANLDPKTNKKQTPLKTAQFDNMMGVANEYAKINPEFAQILSNFEALQDKEKNFAAQQAFHKVLSDALSAHVKQLSAQRSELGLTTENTNLLEQPEQEPQESQFKLTVSDSLWQQMKTDILNLGSPSIYNKQLMFFSDSISKSFKNVMENFQELNKNLTSYFATSTQRQKERGGGKSSAQDCVDNAEQIISGVTDIAGSEGEKVSVINPRLVKRTKK
jgi:hypothetical protein